MSRFEKLPLELFSDIYKTTEWAGRVRQMSLTWLANGTLWTFVILGRPVQVVSKCPDLRNFPWNYSRTFTKPLYWPAGYGKCPWPVFLFKIMAWNQALTGWQPVSMWLNNKKKFNKVQTAWNWNARWSRMPWTTYSKHKSVDPSES